MARLSASAKARHEGEKAKIESELAQFQRMVADLRSSSESPILKTQKQKEYHKKIQELNHKLAMLNAK